MGTRTTMQQQRDLNRTRERIMAAAQKEFAAHGFAGARTDAIARRARVNERMIFYCFESKEGLYRAVLAKHLSAKAAMIESMPDEDFASSLVRGFAECCDDIDSLRMWQWEALDKSNRKLVAEEERRTFLQSEVARWRRAKATGILPPDADEEMLLLVSSALRAFPLICPRSSRWLPAWTRSIMSSGKGGLPAWNGSGSASSLQQTKPATSSRESKKGPVKVRKQSPARTAAGGGRH